MKRTISILMSTILLLGLLVAPWQVNAANAGSKAGVVDTSSKPLNVRSRASGSSGVVTTLKKGTLVTLMEKSGSWWKVEYAKGRYGYCHEDYIASVASHTATVKTQSTSLNVRSGAGTGYRRIGSLKRGETVLVLSTASGWSRILYNGTATGYVSAQYLSGQAGSGSGDSSGGSTGGTTPVAYPALSLSVPGFKQADSRWAKVEIGSSGKTMAQIGCATTAIAMMESYREGRTIYPDAMSQKLAYTPSGNVYWPSHYTVVTSSEGYLSTIYRKLQEGKPVLFGAKNAYGSQHWVVIAGFTGGESLTAAGFTILDPGTNSRTNLQQFLNSYPNFYKFFYY